MENNLENKEKFFAQYWGQKILGNPFWKELGDNREVGASCSLLDSHLNLKALSQMTLKEGQDFLETFYQAENCEVIEIQVIPEKALIIKFKYPDKETPEDNEGYSYSSVSINAERTSYEYVDWFRYNGFAVAWMGLEVPKLIEYGWIKLIPQSK